MLGDTRRLYSLALRAREYIVVSWKPLATCDFHLLSETDTIQFLYVAEYQPRCTEDGEVGEGEDVNTEMVEKILSGAWHTVETPATNTVSLVPVSPVTHYEIRREVGINWGNLKILHMAQRL